ncbi:MAG: hypothetical protein ABJP48_01300 [Erythrobacter sp.]
MIQILSALVLLQSAPSDVDQEPDATPSTQASIPACADEAYSAFDFWVGEWEVYPAGSDQKAAESRIERVSSGCVIRESWLPLSGADGTSISLLNAKTNRWEQIWVGSDGNRVEFAGGPVDGKMILTGFWPGVAGPGQDALIRMTYTANEDGSVRQFGEASTDQGITWQTAFDLIYRPKTGE